MRPGLLLHSCIEIHAAGKPLSRRGDTNSTNCASSGRKNGARERELKQSWKKSTENSSVPRGGKKMMTVSEDWSKLGRDLSNLRSTSDSY